MARVGVALRIKERDKLRSVLREIDEVLRWYRQTSGALSHYDMVQILKQVQSKVDAERDLIYGK